LTQAIIKFKVGVVLVIDYEKQLHDLKTALKGHDVAVIGLSKSGGLQSQRLNEDRHLLTKYQEYFRGRHYQAFSRGGQEEEGQFGLEIQYTRTEFDPYDISISVEEYKIFEIKGHEIPLSALPAGSTSPKWTTLMDEIKGSELAKLQHKMLAIAYPQDQERLRVLEKELSVNPNKNSLKEEYHDILLRCPIAGMMQVKEYNAEMKRLEVRTTNADLPPSKYLFVSKFRLSRLV